VNAGAVTVIALVVFAWGLSSARLGRADMSAPIVFVTVGLLLSQALRVVEPEATQGIVKLLAEVTLVWVLFADASRVEPRELRKRGRAGGFVHVTTLTPSNESLCYTCRLETFLSLNSEGVSDGTSYCCI